MKKLITFLMVCLTISFSFYTQAQSWNQKAQSFQAPYSQLLNSQNFGNSVAIDGNYAVVGAPQFENYAGAAFVYYFNGSTWVLQAKLIASNRESNDEFGCSVSISGNTIVVGATGGYGNAVLSGLAYVFTKPATGWVDMTQTAKLKASDGVASEHFGNSVSISGNVIVVGAEYAGESIFSNSEYDGAAYVFTKPGTNWVDMTQTAKLGRSYIASANYQFGSSVSISGDIIVVGSPANSMGRGAAYVYTKPVTGWGNINESAILTASDRADGDSFGSSVSISGDNIVVGAYGNDDNGSSSGSAYVFKKPTNGWVTMSQTAKLLPSVGFASDYFGYSVSISGDTIVVGAYGYNNIGTEAGVAYVFVKPLNGWTAMNQTAIISNSDPINNNRFGYSVAISENIILTGALYDDDAGFNSGAFYGFTKPTTGWVDVTQTQKIVCPTYSGVIENYYGSSVAIDGNYAVVGATGNDTIKGAAYVLYYNGNSWVTQAKLTASDRTANDNFGCSVSISGDNIVVGAFQDSDNGAFSGSAYVFTKPVSGWTDMTQTAKIKPSDGAANDYFGRTLCISGDNIVVGAIYDDSNAGSAYVFTKPSLGWINMTQTAKLTASDRTASDYFGSSVGISEGNIVIGASGDDSKMGSVYVFTEPALGWSNMTQTAKLTASDRATDDHFGSSISISGDTIVVGSPQDDDNGSASGSAYVFVKPTSTWINMIQTAKLKPNDGAIDDYFGSKVSISGNNVVVGSYQDDDNGYNSGSAYVFTKPVSGWTHMTQTNKIMPNNGGLLDNFGVSVGISGKYIIVGAKNNDVSGLNSGSAYLFEKCYPTASTDIHTACDAYTWINGITYTESNNSATDTLVNFAGCDSVVTLNLTINHSTAGTDVQSACNSFTWIDGNTYTSSNNTATFTLPNSVGCDSVVTLILTINSNIATHVVSACNNYTWIDGVTYTSSNNTATHTLTNIAGCDSVVTLNLTVNYPNVGTDVKTACDSYTWIDGNTYTSSNNTATYTLPNSVGCDSVVTLNLTIKHSTSGIDAQSACNSYTWIDGNTYTSSNNTATYTTSNSVGCDSVITLNLTINSVVATINQLALSLTAYPAGGSYRWLNCNSFSPISGQQNQVYTPTANGSYAVEVTKFGCVDTSLCVSLTGVGVNENAINSHFQLFPNPTTGEININLNSIKRNVKISVLDITGKLVSSDEYKDKQLITFTINNSPGFYFVEVLTDSEKIRTKIVKQ